MQVANTLNNTIRILFNPKIESFKLFDFLIVKSLNDRYLAQIYEIYEDKFDSSQNVAKLKLFYKVTQDNEVMPYDNFTPSKECEILKVKPNEVENFINNDKETFIFATDVKTSQALNIQYDFFNKNAIILADKIESASTVSINLAKKLSAKKHSVLIDYTGVVEFDGAKKIKACVDFRVPLNFSTLDYVFEKCLSDASLEFQAIGIEILNAIKKFAKRQENGFIPFGAFVNVLLQQYKATPYPELQLLLARIQRYQMYNIFVKNKKDYESLQKVIEENEITIIDLSGIDNTWKKAYLNYIIDEIKNNIYLILRINDECFDSELINKIYNEKKNINFLPNVSYNYSKLPSILQYCKNYILLPSLYQRNDFLDANFALSNLISNECILFGENTDNFLYLARDYELESQEKRKNYRKIALSLLEDENEDSESAKIVEEDTISDSQRLIAELSDLEEQTLREHQEEIAAQETETEKIETEEIEPKETEIEETKVEEIEDKVTEVEEPELQDAEIETEKTEESDVIKEFLELDVDDDNKEDKLEEQTSDKIEEIKLSNEPNGLEIVNEQSQDEFPVIEEAKEEDKEDIFQPLNNNAPVSNISDDIDITNNNYEIINIRDDAPQEIIPEQKESVVQENLELKQETENLKDEQTVVQENQGIDISDEELDFFELAEKSMIIAQEEQQQKMQQETTAEKQNIIEQDSNIIQDSLEIDKTENNIIDEEDNSKDDGLDLSEVAQNSIDNNFEEIINSKATVNKQTFEIDENTAIQVDVNEAEHENLPIFKEEIDNISKTDHEYKVGDVIVHAKHGRGTIIKIIQYRKRQLLQIKFESLNEKLLLDPQIAEFQLV